MTLTDLEMADEERYNCSIDCRDCKRFKDINTTCVKGPGSYRYPTAKGVKLASCVFYEQKYRTDFSGFTDD